MKNIKKLLKFVKGQDLYGHKISVTYKGEDSYKTWPGAFCTIAVYTLVVFNLYLLVQAF